MHAKTLALVAPALGKDETSVPAVAVEMRAPLAAAAPPFRVPIPFGKIAKADALADLHEAQRKPFAIRGQKTAAF
jgi:hypothetical protein